MSGHGHVIEAIAIGLLVVGSLTAIPWTPRRYLFYCFAFVAFSSYFVLGPVTAVYVLGAGALGGGAQWAIARRSGGASEEGLDRARALVPAAGAAAAAMLLTDAVRRAFGLRVYPLPMTSSGDVGAFVVTLTFLFVAFTLCKEPLGRIAQRPAPAPAPALDATVPGASAAWSSASLYVIIAVVGFPLHVAAQAAYVRDAVWPWVGVLLWSLLMNAVIGREVVRMRRVEELVRQLAAKERLAAIGEVTARVVHQTRHQLGLIGIIVRRIEKRVPGLSEEDAAVVRGELAKLGDVQRELADMLTRDLRAEARSPLPAAAADAPPPPRPPARETPSSYAAIVAQIAGALEGLAVSRGVALDVSELAAAEGFSPRDADNVGRAVFNVLENAIVAARSRVWVEAKRDGEGLAVAVSDDGPGVPDHLLRQALEPFVTTKPDGTGMGLAIAQAAVREEGGVLRLVNRPRGGLRVDFLIPR